MPRYSSVAATTGAVLALALSACSSSSSDRPESSGPEPSGPASVSPSAAASRPASEGPTRTPETPVTTSAASVTRYVDPIPAALRASMFQQGSVPASWADWISSAPRQSATSGKVDIAVDRRLPACGKESAARFDSDRHTAGFASRVLADGDLVVARQLTVYHDVDAARAAMDEIAHKRLTCTVYDGQAVTGSVYNDLTDAGELDIPQHDQTLAGETSLAVGGGSGVAWWTVLSRDGKAVALTRVVDPHAAVAANGTPNDSIPFRQAVLKQATTSSDALDTVSP